MRYIFALMLAAVALLGLEFSVLVHEFFHHMAGNKYSKCDTTILIRTIIAGPRITLRWKNSHKTDLKFVPMKQWDKFEMSGCLGRTYFSNEYRPYNDRELAMISRAGLYGSILGYVISPLCISVLYGIILMDQAGFLLRHYGIVVTQDSVFMFSAILFAVIYAFMVIAKTRAHFNGTLKPGWSDGAIEKDPKGYRMYIEQLDPDSIHTYSGLMKLL